MNKNIPKLRFPNFKESWIKVFLSDEFQRITQKNKENLVSLVFSNSATKGVVLQDEFFERSIANEKNYNTYYILEPEDFVYNPRISSKAPVGPININYTNKTGIVSPLYSIFRLKNKKQLSFYDQYFKSNKWHMYMRSVANYGARHDRMNISISDFYNMPIIKPGLIEQKKIASFLNAIDIKENLLTRKYDLMTKYKKGIMQKIFLKQVKFQDENGLYYPDWERKKFNKIFSRETKRNSIDNNNVLTISAQYGLVDQETFFNKSIASKDRSNYYLLKKGDFAYNKSYSNGYPMGAIKRLKDLDFGIVSPLYICFSIKKGNYPSFYEHYFESGIFNKEIHKIAQEGARNHGLLNISVTEFFNDTHLQCPSYEEQVKIGNFLSNIDQKISLLNNEILLLEGFKKGLLEQMLI